MAQTSCNNSLWQKVLSPAKPKELRTYDTFRWAYSTELIESIKLGNIWVFVRLIFGPCWPMNQLNKNPNIT